MKKETTRITAHSSSHPYLVQLQQKGMKIYGTSFRINKNLIKALRQVHPYFMGVYVIGTGTTLDLDKGLLILGPVHSGKTTLMYLIKEKYRLRSCLEIEQRVLTYGKNYYHEYLQLKNRNWCFDDFGSRNTAAHIQVTKQLIEELAKHEKPCRHHIISSLSLEQISAQYGFNIYEILIDHFNIIHL